MQGKDRDRLHAAAFMLGIADVHGEPLPDDVMARHDWSTFLLAKDMYSKGNYAGPDWAPFALWQRHGNHVARVLTDSPGAKELWASIERAFDEPNAVALQLPQEITYAQTQWALTSKRTPKAHSKHCMELKQRAESLAREIDRIESFEMNETGEQFDFMRLLGEDEKDRVRRAVWQHNLYVRNTGALEVEGRELGYKVGDISGTWGLKPVGLDEYTAPDDPDEPDSWSPARREACITWNLLTGDPDDCPGIVPKIGDMLRLLARYFENETKVAALQRPAYPNAERNFVARHLCKCFHESFGKAPPAIIGAIVGMFYPQGITDNEVSQMSRKFKSGSRARNLKLPRQNRG